MPFHNVPADAIRKRIDLDLIGIQAAQLLKRRHEAAQRLGQVLIPRPVNARLQSEPRAAAQVVAALLQGRWRTALYPSSSLGRVASDRLAA